MSKSPKMVLEGLNWVSRAVLSPDNDDIGIFWKFILEHMKKASFCKKMPDFINFYPSFILFSYILDFFYQKMITPS